MKLDWFKELEAKRDALNKMIQDEGKEKLGEVFGELFTKYPEIKSVAWLQYTPHFNDGDECVFSIHDPVFLKEKFKGSIYDYEDEEKSCFIGEPSEFVFTNAAEKPEEQYNWARKQLAAWEENKERAKDILDFRASVFDEDVFRVVFGDHVQIVATPGLKGKPVKFKVEDHDHD